MTIRGLARKMLFSVLLGILVIFVLSFSADVPRLLQVLGRFNWRLLPVILALTLLNYALRFVKWHYYLKVIGERDVPLGLSFTIFVAGLAMAITPGKVGELLKAYLLRHHRGTPIGTAAPVIVAERLTDGVAMVLLASGGLLIYGMGWQMLVPIVLAIAGVVWISQHRAASRRVVALAERVPPIAQRIHHLEDVMASARQLFLPRNLVLAIGIGVVSWSGEAVAFFLVLIGLGLPPTPILAVQAAFILATATLVGAASMLPGGLAAAEGSLDGLLLLLKVTREPSVAAAATLLIRFCTLWLGVAVGLIGLTVATSRLTDKDLSASAETIACGASDAPDADRIGQETDEVSSARG